MKLYQCCTFYFNHCAFLSNYISLWTGRRTAFVFVLRQCIISQHKNWVPKQKCPSMLPWWDVRQYGHGQAKVMVREAFKCGRGRRILVQSAITSQAFYHPTAFDVPVESKHCFIKLTHAFLWAGTDKINWGKCNVNWETMCHPTYFGWQIRNKEYPTSRFSNL